MSLLHGHSVIMGKLTGMDTAMGEFITVGRRRLGDWEAAIMLLTKQGDSVRLSQIKSQG
jgi:hypothetical protein